MMHVRQDSSRMIPTFLFIPCYSSSQPVPEPGKETSQRQTLPCCTSFVLPWHSESGIFPVGNAAINFMTSRIVSDVYRIITPPFLPATDEYGKGFRHNQSNPHTGRDGFACKKFSVDSSFLPQS